MKTLSGNEENWPAEICMDDLSIKVLFISPTRMRASTFNFFNPPDTKLRKLKVEGVILGRGMNKNYNG